MEDNRRQLLLGTLIGVAIGAPLGTLIGVAVGGPLLGMMGIIFLASVTLLLVASPLLLLVSPILIIAVFLLAATLTAFSVAGAMAVAGVWALKWAVWVVRGQVPLGLTGTEWAAKLKAATGLRSDGNGEVEVGHK